MMEEYQQKTDQIAFHFYTKLFSLVHDARLTADHATTKSDKWFNLESPDSDLFTKDARELYKSVTRHTPPPFELEVILTIPELAPNQAVVYLAPNSSRARVEPTPEAIVLEVWSVALTGEENYGVTPPPIYKHGMSLFRSIYTFLRTLPTWALYKRIRRRTGGLARTGALSISLRLRSQSSSLSQSYRTLAFHQQPSPALSPISTMTHTFPHVQLPPGTLGFSVTYLSTPYFEIDELESLLSSRFISADLNAGEGFVPTLNKSRQSQSPPSANTRSSVNRSPVAIHKEPNESIAERFILPAKSNNLPNSSPRDSPRDPLARLRKESITNSLSPTSSPRQRKQSLNSNPSPSSSIISQGPFLTNSTSVGFPTTTATTTSTTSPLPIRRPNINPVHPFKTNTLSSPSSSSPSVSLRTGGPSSLSNPANNLNPINTNPTIGAQPSSVSSTHSSNLHTHLRQPSAGGTPSRPPPSPTSGPGFGERERRTSTLSTMSTGDSERALASTGGGGASGEGTGAVPVPVPSRKRYSSSFGHRYVGSVGSNAGSARPSTPDVSGSGGGGGPGFKPPYLSTNPDEDDISIFVQDIDSRKPLSGRVREYERLEREREREHSNSSRSRSRSRTRPLSPRDREPLGRLPEIGLGLVGISNWAPYGPEGEPEAEHDDEDEGDIRYRQGYGFRDRRLGKEGTEETLRGGNHSEGLASSTSPNIPNSSSPPISPTLLHYRYQQQQQQRQRLSASPSNVAGGGGGGGGLSVSPSSIGQTRISSRTTTTTSLHTTGTGITTTTTDTGTSATSPPTSPEPYRQAVQIGSKESTEPSGVVGVTTGSKKDRPSYSDAQAYQLSVSPTSPARGPMLTNQEEVGERLKRMNEVFLKSLEGLGMGSSERRRRREKEKERELERERVEEKGGSQDEGGGGHQTSRNRGGYERRMMGGGGGTIGFPSTLPTIASTTTTGGSGSGSTSSSSNVEQPGLIATPIMPNTAAGAAINPNTLNTVHSFRTQPRHTNNTGRHNHGSERGGSLGIGESTGSGSGLVAGGGSSRYSQGSEEVIGRMDVEPERERERSERGSRFRRY